MTFVIWMTGLPCSGKTSIARKLRDFIPDLEVLDGDELREWISAKDFSRQGRIEHNRKVAHLAKILARHNIPVCASLISPYAENRETARKIIGERFIETYIKCSLEACEKRDTKDMYKKARNNEIKNFTGISDDYDIPTKPDLILDSENNSLEECVKSILNYIKSQQLERNT